MKTWIKVIPGPLVRTFARPYVAGDSVDRACDVARQLLAGRGITTTLDLLAEDIEDDAQVSQNLHTYLGAVDTIAREPAIERARDRPTVSIKLSSFTTRPLDRGGDARGAVDSVRRVAAHAAARKVRFTLDMEGHPWTDLTLALFSELHAAHEGWAGIVLQSRLHRTDDDILALPPGSRVRVVIGIYNEPAAIALTEKTAMKERMLTQAERLIQGGHFVEFATHDEALLDRFLLGRGSGAGGFEVQMLYGVPRTPTQDRLVAAGIPVRLYVPFATSWPSAVAYLRRRLDEYPQMIGHVAKNLLRL